MELEPERMTARRQDVSGQGDGAATRPRGGARRPHLTLGVPGVPQSVPQVLAGPRGGVHHLEGDAGVAVGAGGLVLPVGLRDLLPHHHVEAAAGLVAEDEAGVVIVPVGVDVKRAAEVNRPKLIETWVSGRHSVTGLGRKQPAGNAWLARDPRIRTG